MRLIAVSIGTILIALFSSACTDTDSGSTGIVCNTENYAPLCFRDGVDYCEEVSTQGIRQWTSFLGRTTSPMPSTFQMSITSAEGDSLCGNVGGTSGITLETRTNNFDIARPQRGAATVSNLFDCEGTSASLDYAYRPQNEGSQEFQFFNIFRIYTGGKGTIGLFATPPLGSAEDPDATAQFCYETDISGTYKVTARDGSTQEGTWTY